MRRTLVVCILIAAAVVALPPTAASAKTHDVTVGVPTNAFTPSSLTVEVGDTVRWSNVAGNHNVIALDGTFNSGAPSSDDWTYSFTFTKAGTYDYVCAVHSQMTGIIVVVPGDTPSPTPTSTSPSPTPTTPSPSPSRSTSPSPSPSPTVTTTSTASPTTPATSSPTASPRPTTTTGTTSPTNGTSSPTAPPTGSNSPGDQVPAPKSTTPPRSVSTLAPTPAETDTASDGAIVLGERQERPAGPGETADPTATDPEASPAATDSADSRWILVPFIAALLAAAGGVVIWRRRQP